MDRVAFLVEGEPDRLECLLNPETLVMRRVAGVRPRRSATGAFTGAGLSDDPVQFTGGGRTELDLDLLFDVSLSAASQRLDDIRDLTSRFWHLAEQARIVQSLGSENHGRLPVVRFVWGKSWNIPGLVVAVSERLDQFRTLVL